MQSSGKRLQQFIQDFLTYSALETGGLRMQFDPATSTTACRRCVACGPIAFRRRAGALLSGQRQTARVSLRFAQAGTRDLESAGEFFQVHAADGTVWLHAEPYMWERRAAALPSARNAAGRTSRILTSVKVSVSDTGPGIPAEFHLEVFDDFFRLPGTEAQEGMGLGLAIARRLVQGMGGKIWVESDSGAAASFHSSFLTNRQSPPPAKVKKPMKPTAKILLVDDEPGMLRYIKTLLEVDDYKVETATTGEEALQPMEKGLQPDLVLLDVLMPGIDGLQTLEQLRQSAAWRESGDVVVRQRHSQSRPRHEAGRAGLSRPSRFRRRNWTRSLISAWARASRLIAEKWKSLPMTSSLLRPVRDAQDSIAGCAGSECRHSRCCCWARAEPEKKCWEDLIHKLSPRAHRTFLKVNCAAVPADLLESELFGYEQGAFTGATHAKPGKFELCNRGTILLDEIGEMPPLAASQTSARVAGWTVLAAGQPHRDQSGCAHSGRDQYQHSGSAGQ